MNRLSNVLRFAFLSDDWLQCRVQSKRCLKPIVLSFLKLTYNLKVTGRNHGITKVRSWERFTRIRYVGTNPAIPIHAGQEVVEFHVSGD